MSAPLPTSTKRRWYQEPYVWLVVGGPLAVVIASIFTVYLAVNGADPVLDRASSPVKASSATLDQLTPEARLAAEKALLPAGQGRNHAVTPALPQN